ncbi:nuclear transport factor 2 family protein [Acinetobacter sp.]|jgi:ketosteroid isomerase-like protein|uniref:YybH family protein n=1 Tax=Acinetobacter sp. TaxID=472 RepID=UPI0028232B56|nr:nuclear transport factor 2 family protein [Acinetobacter sp.]MDR0237511.1 nuclear transport factor 2 family protein [Acinetobacter sp.]
MKIEIAGNSKIAAEVISQIQIWDAAVVGNSIEHLLDQCAHDVSMFDVSSQMEGVQAYKLEWEKFSHYFSEHIQIVRRNMKIYASNDLAILHCHSKVENSALKEKLQMPWCRTTLCLQKKDGQWLVVHQHISMPIDMSTGKVIMLKDKAKLRLVV